MFTEDQIFEHKANLRTAIVVKLIDELNKFHNTGRITVSLDDDMVDVIWDELTAEIIPAILDNPFMPNDYLPYNLAFKVDAVNLDFSIFNAVDMNSGSLPYRIIYNAELDEYTLDEYLYEPE